MVNPRFPVPRGATNFLGCQFRKDFLQGSQGVQQRFIGH
jgi:hypothetical protein